MNRVEVIVVVLGILSQMITFVLSLNRLEKRSTVQVFMQYFLLKVYSNKNFKHATFTMVSHEK